MNTQDVEIKTKWILDTGHCQVNFKVKYMNLTFLTGRFNEFEACIYTTGNDLLTAEIDFWINSASIDTGNENRDKHLKGPDFLDAEKFKEINFTANTITYGNVGIMYELYGELTLKGISKKIKLEVEFDGILKDSWGNTKAFLRIKTKINRKNWEINWNVTRDSGSGIVSNEVWLESELVLIKYYGAAPLNKK